MSRHLLIIGAQRSGSTYLYSLLESHPQIAMARPVRPEPKVFLDDTILERGPTWYRETYFAHVTDEVLLGEKSTSYLEVPQAAVRARQVLGDPHVLVVLRDPVSRAVSNWRFSTDNGLETRPLDVALRENLAGAREWDPTSTSVSPFAYLERGRFDGYLEPWARVFGQQLRVVFLPELVSGGTGPAELFEALGVEPVEASAALGERVNASREPAPELPDDLVSELREFFRPSDLALAERLQRELPWSIRFRP